MKTDDERASSKKLNIERNRENIISNEISIDNYTQNNKINFENKKLEKTTNMSKENFKYGKESEPLKSDNQKILNDRLDNKSLKVSNQTLNTKINFAYNNIIESINTRNINKAKNYKIDKIIEIHENKQKNNNIKKQILLYQGIIMPIYNIINNKSYISELKKDLNYEFNWLYYSIFNILANIIFSNEPFIEGSSFLQYKAIIIKVIMLIIIIKTIALYATRKFKSQLSRIITNINKRCNQNLYIMKQNLFVNEKKEFHDILDLNRRRKKLNNKDNKLKEKLEKKGRNNIIENYIPISNIVIDIIKFIIIINLFCRTKNNIYDFNSFHDSKIKLKIKGFGENLIFDSKYIDYLKEVHINGQKQNGIPNKYNFDQEYNNVELIFDDNINNTENMFKDCISITEINLSNFDTSNVISMDNMFEGCSSLTSIDLSNLKTSSVKRMIFMFSGCSSLTSLNISHFDTSSVTRMDSMFSHCSSLTSLNLSNFDFLSATSIDTMFCGCSNLEYINIYNFNEEKLKPNMFQDVPNNFVLCIKGGLNNNIMDKINNSTSSNKTYSNMINKKCFVIDCSNDWKAKQKKIISNNNECVESCDNIYQYEYNGKCYDSCQKGFLNDNNNNPTKNCKCELDKCLLCPQVALNHDLCTECNIDYYPKENDTSNLGEYINCYKNPEGYYLDNNLYKKCYETCKTCNKKGNSENHNCLTCDINFPFIIEKSDNINCYANCSYYYYPKENNYYCTMSLSCPEEYPRVKKNSQECTDSISAEDVMNEILKIDDGGIGESKLEQIKYYNKILESIESGFTSVHFDTSNIDNGEDEVIKTDKMTITFTNSENQKNNVNKNATSINLGECETLLRNYYNISSNETLYMKKMDIVQEGTKALKVEYDVYCKLNGTNLIKLNLTICGGSKISIIIPIEINDDLDKLNTSSGYYNDICYTTTSEDGTDISLNDRKKEYIENDKIVCQEGCSFSDYDYNNKAANCSCDAKQSSLSISDMKIDKDKLLANFKDIKNIVNFEFLKCYKVLFTKEGILNNYACYLILIIFLFHILSIFIFFTNNYRVIEKKIIIIASNKNNEQSKKGKEIKNIKRNPKLDDKEIFIFRVKNEKNMKKLHFGNLKSIKNNRIKNGSIKKPKTKDIIAKKPSTKDRKQIKNISKNRIINNSSSKNNIISSGYLKNSTVKISIYKKDKMKNTTRQKNEIKGNPLKKRSIKNTTLKNKINPKSIINKKAIIGINENFNNYIDEEINRLPYIIAIKYDKRNYCQYYGSLLKTQHNLICALFNNSDYNSGIIKIDLFLIGFVIEYTVNALFYNDNTMHDIYESKGQFNLEKQLPIIIYSYIISYLLNYPLNLLALSNDSIIGFKQGQTKTNIMKRAKKLINMLNIKFILYFFISSVFLIFFWYYLCMFGAIYKNTQFHLLKDVLISFLLSLFFPFVIYLLPGFLRIPALSKKNGKSCSYNFSKFLQSF